MKLALLMIAAIAAPLAVAAPVAAQQAYTPQPTLADEMARTKITFAPGYLDTRPRLLFGPDDKQALTGSARTNEEIWSRVLRQARSTGKYVPDPETIRTGKQYWRAEYILSGALAWFITGEPVHRDNAVKWMIAHCAEEVWGTGYNENVDLFAAWYLYYISLAYDVLHDTLSETERNAIRAGLISHAEAIYESKLPPQQFRYDQNHTYIPTTALATAGLALAGETPLAEKWLKLACPLLDRCRYVLGDDGYYYEGTGYWQYAIHWHVRYADLATRAFGGRWHDLPTLRHNWRFALHMSIPGSPFMWDIGDGGSGAAKRPDHRKLAWNHMLYRLAGAHNDGTIRAVGDWLVANSRDADDPAMQLLWVSAAAVEPADLAKLAPYHHFTDHGVVTWRSGWDDDATCYLFKAGPPQGHAATAKLRQMTDWKMNSGHVHPDIGAFWIFAAGEYLAVDTGYTARKRTDDHNTLLVDGRGQGRDVDVGGQGDDGYYWIYRDQPYAAFDKVRITKTHLTRGYGYAAGDLAAAYDVTGELGGLSMVRHVVMTREFMVVVDDLAGARPHEYTWLMHTDTPISPVDGGAFESVTGDMRLLTYPLSPDNAAGRIRPTMVFAGTSPGKGSPAQRGYQLELSTPGKVPGTRFITLMLPLAKDQPAPRRVRLSRSDGTEVTIRIHWPNRAPEIVRLNPNWKPGDPAGPADLSTRSTEPTRP